MDKTTSRRHTRVARFSARIGGGVIVGAAVLAPGATAAAAQNQDGPNRPELVDGPNRPELVDGPNRPELVDGPNRPKVVLVSLDDGIAQVQPAELAGHKWPRVLVA